MRLTGVAEATSFLLVIFLPSLIAKASSIEQIKDKKAFEKTIRTRTNVLVLFKKSPKDAPASLLQTLEKVADQLKGTALIAQVDCSSPDAQKVCKKEKADTGAYILRHYQKGEFHKVYDRPENLKTFLSFLKDPTAEAPWEDDPTSKDVLHIEDSKQLRTFLSSEKKPTLLMFYAPWCGHCMRLKPGYSAAATELKNEAVLVAMDVNKPHNNDVREAFNITGFPTLYYFRDGKFQYPFGGERSHQGIVSWMRKPTPPTRMPEVELPPQDVPMPEHHEEL
ncbi:hypothetical protein RvY_14744 [Ramazzottius varieornatus]|uniref:Thioredoxin domain-containing protein n=1 Tax=Ramazzottius varieornatus TaxID=947166 RepID=A0A1D1VZL4_RAMVA|nr:hypothetical protein RvY_14744 [Ramazzottius varieornatus]